MLKNHFIKIHWILSSQFGIDLRILFKSLLGIPRFLLDWRKFRKNYLGEMKWMPCLHDRFEEGGATKNEYFWQDLLVARWIFEAKPQKHVDIGSRVDGFVAHVASFREIEVFDVRPIRSLIPGIIFKRADLMQRLAVQDSIGGYCDSLSCLHAIEHFGLGRYGDPIDSAGHESGIANMASLLVPGGMFYLSTPIGKGRVEFNAMRIFDPRVLIDCVESNGLVLQKMIVIRNEGEVEEFQASSENLYMLAESNYNLGVFVFKKFQSS